MIFIVYLLMALPTKYMAQISVKTCNFEISDIKNAALISLKTIVAQYLKKKKQHYLGDIQCILMPTYFKRILNISASMSGTAMTSLASDKLP